MIFPLVNARGLFEFQPVTEYLQKYPDYVGDHSVFLNHSVGESILVVNNFTTVGKPQDFSNDYISRITDLVALYRSNGTYDLARIYVRCMAFFTNPQDSYSVALENSTELIFDYISFQGSLNLTMEKMDLIIQNPNIIPTDNTTVNDLLKNATITQLNVTNASGLVRGNLYSNSDNVIYAGNFDLHSVSFHADYNSINSSFKGLSNSRFNFTKNNDGMYLTILNSTIKYDSFASNSSIKLYPISGSVDFGGLSSYLLKCTNGIVTGDANDGNSFSFTLPIVLAVSLGMALLVTIISLGVVRRHYKRRVVPISAIPMISYENLDMNSRISRFLEMYPPNTSEAKTLAKEILYSDEITMLQPIVFPEFPFAIYPPPRIDIEGTMVQNITIKTNQPVSIQCSQPFQPQLQLLNNPPPSFEPTSNPNVYIEVIVSEGDACIGFATLPYPSFVLPGYETQSIAYHTRDGKVYLNSRFGMSYGTAKKIGIGYRVTETTYNDHVLYQVIFFFCLDGLRVGDEVVVEGVDPADLYFICGSDSDCSFKVNFGDLTRHK
ncbi:Rsp5p-dependent ubiquitination, sorting of cargo proteins at the multivesicular body [Boothiomyces macroporosus]|uniref:Rsp5p-dependent ubiquitination, sorting of cargo proteins at the multivesicular body n=1 Tax=Boothiomyces macroporosus TaxID=261099 RepID=A0AAD5Y3Q5_9FUNG|nr:Rsp5p-dependent ubiquitination, sorting of cargo proteins at the multivesicular body [Boothiomyces macroporosus]